jgi:soluble lytic murein transglycosylase-like protein
MRRLLTISVLALFATALHARETAVLRSGFSISHDHRQQIGDTTRLFLGSSEMEYVDVPTDSIASFEKEEEVVVPTPVASTSPTPPATVDQIVEKAARDNQLDSDFVRAVIRAESRGNANAVSRKGAQGLMQLMPQTATGLGVKNSFDPNENVAAGTRYLRGLLSQYHNDPVRALAAYNAGAERVQQYNGVPPYKETRAYVAGVIRDFNRRKLEQTHLAKNQKKLAKASTGNHPPNGD